MKKSKRNQGAQHKRPGRGAKMARQERALEAREKDLGYWTNPPIDAYRGAKQDPRIVTRLTEEIDSLRRKVGTK